MNNELLKQCKDEVAKSYGTGYLKGDGWLDDHHKNVHGPFWESVCELYSSRQREELQERVERYENAIKEVLRFKPSLMIMANNRLQSPQNCVKAFDELESALSGEATKEKDESLEAYNRECKRVDELTEEVAMLQSRLKSEYERGYNQGMVEAVKEL